MAWGHQNVLAEHPNTLEITKDLDLTKSGDCVIAVGANKGLKALSNDFKRTCQNDAAEITLELRAGGLIECVQGCGSSKLTLSDPSEIVCRKSTHISDRTIMISANKAASDLRRDFVHLLRSPNTTILIRLIAVL